MNVQLSQAVSDITGVTGQTIIRAILAGERTPQRLASMREAGCKKSEEEIGKALTGSWRDEHLFILKQSVAMYDFYTKQMRDCDEEIERVYGMTRPDWEAGEVAPLSRRKRSSHSKNAPHHAEEIRVHLKRISGVDLSVWMALVFHCTDSDHGSGDGYTCTHRRYGVTKFPDEKHFFSWLGFAPKHEISGGKILKNKTLKTKNRAGQAFRMAAQSVKQADCVFGVLYRRLRVRLGPAQATVVTAHAIARVVYRMLTLAPHASAGEYQVEFEPLNVNEYQRHYEEQQIKYMKKKAAKFGFQLVPA